MTEKQLIYQMEVNLFGTEKVIRRNTLRSNVIQSLMSPAYLLAVIGTVIVLCIGVATDIVAAFQSKELLEAGTHLELITKAMGSEPLVFALPILSAVPYTTAYMDDLRSGYVKEYLPRTTRKQYILGKVAACMLSGGAAVLCGIVLFVCVVTIVCVPVEMTVSMEDVNGLNGGLIGFVIGRLSGSDISSIYDEWLGEFFQGAILNFLAGAFWSFAGMVMASFTSSRYMAYGGSFILYYVLIILCERYFPACYVLYPKEWLDPSHIPYGVPGVLVIYVELWCLMMGCFCIWEDRRLRRL